MPKPGKQHERIDRLLVEMGLAQSSTRAQALVMAGLVLANEQRIEKPSEVISRDASIRVKGFDEPALRYVGRGGLKLEAALNTFQIDVINAVCLDVGASTGGFTDCLLKHGANRVVAIDVGHNQLDWRLRSDPRVESREGANARYLRKEDFANLFHLIVMDVSFISATRILPVLPGLLANEGSIVVLIKPQFEVGRLEVGRGGVIRDEATRARAAQEVNRKAEELGLIIEGLIESPVSGADGNREFLAWYRKGPGNLS